MKYRIRKVYFSKDEPALFFADYKSDKMIAWRVSSPFLEKHMAELQVTRWRDCYRNGTLPSVLEDIVVEQYSE